MNYSYFYIYSSFAGFVICAFAAVLVIVRNPRSNLNRAFFLAASGGAAYDLLGGFLVSSHDLSRAFIINRASVSAWLIFLTAQLYFSMALAKAEKGLFARLLLGLALLLSVGLSALHWSSYLIYQPSIMTPFGVTSLPGPYGYYFTGFSMLVAGLQFTYFGLAWTKAKNKREKEQVLVVMAGLAAGSLIGGFSDIVAPLFGFFTQSLGGLSIIVYIGSFAYAMVRYGLLAVTPSAVAGEIVNTMPGLLVVVGPDRRISLVNRRIVEQLGYTAEELVGQPLDSLIAAPEAAALCAQIETRLEQNGTIKEQRTQLRCRNERVFPVLLDAVRARDQFSNDLGNVLIFHDISEEQKLLEKQEAMIAELTSAKERTLSLLGETATARDEAKQKTEELAKAIEDLKAVDKMKTEFLSVISHELRTPLTSINGYASLMLDGQIGPLSDDQKKGLEVVKREGGHLLRLIDSLIDVSRLVSGKAMEIKKEPVLIKRLIDDIVSAMSSQLNENKVVLSVELPPDFPTIQGDPGKLSQLLTNILGNSMKYIPKAGQIKVLGSTRGDQVEVSITDNGIGVAKENLGKIFEEFFQVDSSITRSSGGVGLGLSIAREIVAAHGGKIWAESQGLGWGLAIKFTLPVT